MVGRQTVCGVLLAATLCAIVCVPTPCRACTVFDMSSSGFASSVWHLIPALALFAENGTFFVNSYPFPYKCSADGGFLEWFDAPSMTRWTQEAEDAQPDAPCRRTYSKLVIDTVYNEVPVRPDGYSDLIEIVLPQVWRLRPHVKTAVEPLLAQLDMEPKPTIGFHIRGGDKMAEDILGNRTTTWAMDYINAFLEEKQRLVRRGQAMSNGTCVLAGDDAALLAEAAALAQERLGCKVFTGRAEYLMAKHSQGTFDALPLPERCAATMHLLTDLELLAHTDYFVGTYNSGLPHLIDKLRYVVYGKHRRTTIDASEHKRDWYAGIRKWLSKQHPLFEYDYKWQPH